MKAKDRNHDPMGERKTTKYGEKVGGSRPFDGFVNINLSEADKEHYRGWTAEFADEVLDMLFEVVLGGLNLSLKNDKANNCVVATLTGAGCVLRQELWVAMSARASNPADALTLLTYKHVVIAQGDWTRFWKAEGGLGAEL